MSVIITNREPQSDLPLYTIEIAGQVIAEFRHRRQNGLRVLLETAARAVALKDSAIDKEDRATP